MKRSVLIILIAFFSCLIPFLIWRLQREQNPILAQQEKLATELGVNISDYPGPRSFPTGYFYTTLNSEMTVEEVHKIVKGYEKVLICTTPSEVYYYFSQDDTKALRFEIVYYRGKYHDMLGEGDSAGRLSIEGCIPGQMIDSVMIQDLEQNLQGDLDQETRKSLETKLQNLYAEVTQRAVAVRQLTSIPNRTYIPPTFQPGGERELGIIEYPTNPFIHTDYKITNAWQELINGDYITVYAGSLVSNPKQGIIIMQMETSGKTKIYLTPDLSGATKISSANGFRLIVLTANSRTYYFDVPAEKFVSSINEIVPTVTQSIPKSTQGVTITPTTPYP